MICHIFVEIFILESEYLRKYNILKTKFNNRLCESCKLVFFLLSMQWCYFQKCNFKFRKFPTCVIRLFILFSVLDNKILFRLIIESTSEFTTFSFSQCCKDLVRYYSAIFAVQYPQETGTFPSHSRKEKQVSLLPNFGIRVKAED